MLIAHLVGAALDMKDLNAFLFFERCLIEKIACWLAGHGADVGAVDIKQWRMMGTMRQAR